MKCECWSISEYIQSSQEGTWPYGVLDVSECPEDEHPVLVLLRSLSVLVICVQRMASECILNDIYYQNVLWIHISLYTVSFRSDDLKQNNLWSTSSNLPMRPNLPYRAFSKPVH